MTVTVPATAAVVLFAQGSGNTNPTLIGGARTIPAIVLAAGGAGGLVTSVFAITPENAHEVVTGVQHVSVAPIGAPNWSWPPASGNSNA